MLNHTRPSVHFALPSTFNPFPAALPEWVPPPVNEYSWRAPFGINENLYNFVLRPEIPFTTAAIYVFTVFSLNAYNRDHHGKPWRIAKTAPFQSFVIVHNVVLAIYSLLTCIAMTRAATHVWPGWSDDTGAAGIVDAFCKLHGPRIFGDAATYNTTINIWETKNPLIRLTSQGTPDSTDVGRLWNEGLAFWGWLFYVSKFYEIIDTLIIIAKGRRCATLQTYHHAGAILSMWAGIRYMSPPIWMFVWINSGIHALMVPRSLKRSLTTIQILQFLAGVSYAALHLFIQYDVPITSPYTVANIIQKVVSVASDVSTAATSAASVVISSPIATASVGMYLKKLLLRAAGEEGVAERVHNERGELLNPKIGEKIQHAYERTFETRYHTQLTRTNCLDTSGQAFAIYLNLFYLLPLTWLFGRFFVKAYLSRGKPRTASDAAKQAFESVQEAGKETQDTLESEEAVSAKTSSFSETKAWSTKIETFTRSKVEEFRSSESSEEVHTHQSYNIKEQAEKALNWAQDTTSAAADSVKSQTQALGDWVKQTTSSDEQSTKTVYRNDTSIDGSHDSATTLQTKLERAMADSEELIAKAVKDLTEEAKETTTDVTTKLQDATKDDKVATRAHTDIAGASTQIAEDAKERGGQLAQAAAKGKEQVADKTTEISEEVKKTASDLATSAKEGAVKTQEAVEEVIHRPESVAEAVDAKVQNLRTTEVKPAIARASSPDKKSASMIPKPVNRKADQTAVEKPSETPAAQSQSEKSSDVVPVANEGVRPGSSSMEKSTLEGLDDTDAMGRSGINLTKDEVTESTHESTTSEVKEIVEQEAPETEALESGKWHPPGVSAS